MNEHAFKITKIFKTKDLKMFLTGHLHHPKAISEHAFKTRKMPIHHLKHAQFDQNMHLKLLQNLAQCHIKICTFNIKKKHRKLY